MAVKFRCSACGKTLNVADEHAGERGHCPACRAVILIPNGSPAPPAVLHEREAEQVAAPAAKSTEPPRLPRPRKRSKRRWMAMAVGPLIAAIIVGGAVGLLHLVTPTPGRPGAPARGEAGSTDDVSSLALTDLPPRGMWEGYRFALPPHTFLQYLPKEVEEAADDYPLGFRFLEERFGDVDELPGQYFRIWFETEKAQSKEVCRRVAWSAIKQYVQKKQVEGIFVLFVLPAEDVWYFAFEWERPVERGDVNVYPYHSYKVSEDWSDLSANPDRPPVATDKQIRITGVSVKPKSRSQTGAVVYSWRAQVANRSGRKRSVRTWLLFFDYQRKLVTYTWLVEEIGPGRSQLIDETFDVFKYKAPRVLSHDVRAEFFGVD